MKFSSFGSLIKWPQCVIIGEKVTIDQAKEILSRTDNFFWEYGSNNTEWDRQAWNELKMPWWDYRKEFDLSEYDKYVKARDKFKKDHKLLNLEYLNNDYISTCFVGGVHGWCHPDGEIHFWDNIGKWPSWDEIHKDCRILAKEFKFLDIKVYLFNQESDCEEYYDYPKACVGGFKIKNGLVYQLKESEYLDPHAPECSSPYQGSNGGIENYINNQKKNIFGDAADLSVFKNSWGEQFFNMEEFKQYFKV